MANIKSQKKRIITNEKARMRNRAIKSQLKTATRHVKDAVAAACRLMDKAAGKGIIHKNQAANRKSGIMKLANTVVTDADRSAYQPAPKKEQKTGSKKAARKAERLEAMKKASEEKAVRREATLKAEKAAHERKAAEEAAAAAAAAAEAEAAEAEGEGEEAAE